MMPPGEPQLRGKEGTHFVEVDARGRVVGEAGGRGDITPESPDPLYTNIDLDLQRFAATLFGDSLQASVNCRLHAHSTFQDGIAAETLR